MFSLFQDWNRKRQKNSALRTRLYVVHTEFGTGCVSNNPRDMKELHRIICFIPPQWMAWQNRSSFSCLYLKICHKKFKFQFAWIKSRNLCRTFSGNDGTVSFSAHVRDFRLRDLGRFHCDFCGSCEPNSGQNQWFSVFQWEENRDCRGGGDLRWTVGKQGSQTVRVSEMDF